MIIADPATRMRGLKFKFKVSVRREANFTFIKNKKILYSSSQIYNRNSTDIMEHFIHLYILRNLVVADVLSVMSQIPQIDESGKSRF